MLAKGRLLGLQFDELFSDGSYYEVGRNEVRLAQKIADAFKKKGIELYYDSPTNQIFPVLSDEQIMKLSETYSFSVQGKTSGGTVTRFCTSWATTDAVADKLIKDIEEL